MTRSKKIIAILIVMVMALSTMFAMTGTAYAGGEFTEKTLMLLTQYEAVDIFQNAPKGISYSKSNNTLTLNNYKGEYDMLWIGCMGKDFKVKIKGTCTIGGFKADNSISFIGTGKITVNKNKSEMGGISISDSSNKKACVTIGKSLTFIANGCKSEGFTNNPISVYYSGSNANTAKKAIVINGKKTTKGTVKKFVEKQDETMTAYIMVGEMYTTVDATVLKDANGEKYMAIPLVDIYGDGNLEPGTAEDCKYCIVKVSDCRVNEYNEHWVDDYTKYDVLDAIPKEYTKNATVVSTKFYVDGVTFKSTPKK